MEILEDKIMYCFRTKYRLEKQMKAINTELAHYKAEREKEPQSGKWLLDEIIARKDSESMAALMQWLGMEDVFTVLGLSGRYEDAKKAGRLE